MARRMDDDERRAFLAAGTRTGKLAVTRRDGRPHVVPIWFVLDGDDLLFTTAVDTLKGRALLHRRYAAICVDDERPPYAYVKVEGPVELDDDLEAMLPWATRIGARYMGRDRAEEFGRRNAVPGETLARLRPSHVVALDGITD